MTIEQTPSYIQRRDFGPTLAIYLLFNRDIELAELVNSRFKTHPLNQGDGVMRILHCTRMVYDLTNGRYGAVYKYNKVGAETEESLRRDFGANAPLAARVIEEEIGAGRLQGGQQEIQYTDQALVLQRGAPGALYHWLVDCDDGTVIDRGNVCKIVNRGYFFSTLQGVLLLQKYDC